MKRCTPTFLAAAERSTRSMAPGFGAGAGRRRDVGVAVGQVGGRVLEDRAPDQRVAGKGGAALAADGDGGQGVGAAPGPAASEVGRLRDGRAWRSESPICGPGAGHLGHAGQSVASPPPQTACGTPPPVPCTTPGRWAPWTAGARAAGSGSDRRGRRPPAAGCARPRAAGSSPAPRRGPAPYSACGSARAGPGPRRPPPAASPRRARSGARSPPPCASRSSLPGEATARICYGARLLRSCSAPGVATVNDASIGGSQTLRSARPWDSASVSDGSSHPSVAKRVPRQGEEGGLESCGGCGHRSPSITRFRRGTRSGG